MTIPPSSGPITILVVEGEPLLLRFLCTILEQAGYKVLSACSAERAVSIVREFAGTIDLLLTCVSLPRTSGPKMAEKLEWARPGLSVILISSDATACARARLSGWHFVQKPFLPGTLLNTVKTTLDFDLESCSKAG